MRLVRYQPFNDLAVWPDRFSRFFGLDMPVWLDWDQPGPRYWAPGVDVYEEGDDFVIKADLPDVDEKDLKVELADGGLTLKAERKFEREQKRNQFHSVERRFGSFVRRFELPAGTDAGKVSTNYDKGVLTIRITKRQDAKPKQIEVSVSKN